ncbi:MAG: cytochrome [Fibrobacteres bacterium]|nr:cytochrome [Fibrobacterota bacterium]
MPLAIPNRILAKSAWILGGAVLAASLLLLWARFRSQRTFTAPDSPVAAVSDPSVIARGRYLVHGPAHCADCHAPPSEKPKVDAGEEAELSGGYALRTFLGVMRAPNITSDAETGIGRIGDTELARFFRHGIDHRGQVGLPVMMYAGLSDQDLTAILSYLRTVAPVRHAVAPSRYNLLGMITKAFFLEPFDPGPAPAGPPEPGPTREYGGYLATAVANCASCHTARNMKTGEYTGPRFAGGLVFRKSDSPQRVAISPNLTPDPATGVMTGWSRERFVERMRKGSVSDWSPMPWGSFSRMTEGDLGALYLYLSALDPIHRETVPPSKDGP